MKRLEAKRLRLLGGQNRLPAYCGMIIPVVLRGTNGDLPSELAQHRQYCDFSKYTTAGPAILRHRYFMPKSTQLHVTFTI